MTIDSNRPDGLLGRVAIDGRARDLLTDSDGAVRGLEHAELHADVDYIAGRILRSLTLTPPLPLDDLIGSAVSSGFREKLDQRYPDGRSSHGLRYQLLDDLPTALLVSGYAIGAGGATFDRKGPRLQYPDLCAGFVAGGSMLTEEADTGKIPVPTGPDAPPLLDQSDPFACHDVAPLGPHGMRRLRRIDLWRDGASVGIEDYFRDSHCSAGLLETVVHEYTVHASYDPVAGRFVSGDATVHTLPWLECPLAAESATRIGGLAAEGLRQYVRNTFLGPSTCTHLNDTLRALEDIPALAALLPR